MKLDSNLLDITDFNIRECTFGGDECLWVFPKIEGTSWNEKNEVLRSSIWRKNDGQLISAGYKKFFNWGEKPDIHPIPTRINNHIVCVEKIDGSCLIVSKYKGELITRTRRALTASLLNGDELEKVLKLKYPKVFSNPMLDTEQYSFIYEWVTPSNRIVIKAEEPELYLTNIITHDTYSYEKQRTLDIYAKEFGVRRPAYHTYSSFEQMLESVESLVGREGICVYYGNEQHIRKAKSSWYINAHNFRNEMSFKNIVELFISNNLPSYNDFCEIIQKQYDYEGLLQAKSLISQICDAKQNADRIIAGMREFIAGLSSLKTRREQAEKVFAAYGKTNRADMVFTLLDGNDLDTKQIKKLLFQSFIAQ